MYRKLAAAAKRIIKKIYRYAIRSFKDRRNKNPSYMGLTFAVGFFAGASPLYGQSLICLICWLILDRWWYVRFNLVIACILTLISNPLTTPFWFYLFYFTGQWMLDAAAIKFSVFLKEINRTLLQEMDFTAFLKLLLKGLGWPILLGSFPWSIILAVVGYYMGARFSIHFRKKQHRKKKQRIRRMIRYLKKTIRRGDEKIQIQE